MPLADARLVIRVVDAQHREGVADGGEALDGLATDARGWAVGVGELGVFGFEGCEFGEELVELGIGHDGVRVGVIRAVGAGQKVAELGDSFGSVFHGGDGIGSVRGRGEGVLAAGWRGWGGVVGRAWG